MTFDEAVTHVLQQRKYDRLMDRAFDIQKLLARAAEQAVRWILERLRIRGPWEANYNTSFFVFIFIIMAVAAAASVAVAVWLAARRREKREAAMDDLFRELLSKEASYESLKATGEKYAAGGDLRAAVRYEYIALLWLLNAENIVYTGQAKTNSQLAREIRKNAPKLSWQFARAVELFQYAWFGHKPVSREEFDAYVSDLDDLAREARS